MSSSLNKTWLRALLSSAFLGFVLLYPLSTYDMVHAATGINQQLNFQGRLLNSSGATVPDGTYNIEFKIYQDGDGQSVGDTTGVPAGSLKWTEDHLNNVSQGVTIKNGYLSVQLGAVTPFGASINWNQDTLWLSVNIGNTNGSCTPFSSCSPDGEMISMKRLSSNPYAFNAGQLGGLTSAQYVQLAQGLQTDTSNTTNSIYINKTGAGGNFIDLQAGGTDAFVLTNTGDVNFGANTNHNINVTTAGTGIAGQSLTVTAGGAGTGGSTLAGGSLSLQGGGGGGTNGNGGNVSIDAGARNGTGADGIINIGTNTASAVNIATNATAHTIAIGNGGAIQGITIGSTSSTSSLLLQSGTGNLSIQTQGTGGLNIGNNAVAQVITIGNTTGATGIVERVGTANYSLDGVGSSTYTLGASTTTGTIAIGGTAQTGAITIGNSTGIEALNFGTGGTGAKTVVVGSTASTSSTTLQSGTGNLSIQTQGTGTLGIGNNAVAQVVQVGNNTGATSISILSGTGGINFNGSTIVTSTNTFSTGTGAVTIQGAATVSANLTTTNAANIAFQKGADFSTVGTTPNANLGTGVLIRLTGVSAQTITGISNGVDGRVLTLVNAAGQAAIISNLSGGAGNQVSTGTGGDLTLPAGATVSLAYDAGANLWRVIGGGAATGGYIQLQGATPGTQQTGNFNISGIGIASTGFDAAVSGTLNLGTTNASAVNIATNATAHTVGIGTDTTTVQTIAIGSTNGTSSLSLQAGTGSLSVQTQGGTLGIANNSVAQAIVMGNTTGTSSVTVFCGTGSCTFGAGATAHTTTVGTTNTTSTTTLQGGTGGVNIGTGGVSNVIQIGSTTGSTTQTINIGNNAISGSSDSVVIGSTIAGNITLQSAATISIGNNAAAQTINIGNTTGATGILASVGSGNFSLDGATNSTYTLGASTTTGTISIGGTTQTGAITLGNSTAAGILNIANGSGATAVNIANLQNAGSVSIGAAMTTGTISIGGTGAQTGTIAIGTGTGAQNLTFGTGGTAAKILTIGSTASTSSLLLQSGTGNLSIQTQGTGTLGIGNNAVAQTIQVGNNTGATSVTLQSGTGALNIQTQGTGGLNIGNNAVAQVITIGNTTGATGIVERVGTANYSLDGVGSSTYTLGASTTTGTIAIGGTAQTGAITIGNSTGIEALNFGTGGTGAKTVVVGSTASTSSTTLQSGTGNILFTTNNITRGTFDTANNFYFGNGVSAAAPNNFVIQGTGSTTTAVAGGAITLQGGNATVGSANGGNLTLAGGSGFGTGVGGLVVLSTPTFQTASTQTCSSNCTITQANEDGNGAVVINVTVAAVTVTMPDPTTTTAGRIVYVTAALGSNDFTLAVNGGGTGNTIAMRQNTTATMIWNGSDWTAAGASSSTTLQSAYDNTLTSAGGAELVVSNTANHNGLTIRDSSTLPVNATLLEVQTSTAASLFSVNGTVTDYANNGGAEVAFGTEWAGVNSGIATRNTIGTYVANGTGSVKVATTAANTGAKNVLTAALTANLTYNVSFAARLDSTSVGSFTDLNVIYSVDGTASSAACTNYSTQTVPTSVWAKINCTFTVPSSGITSNNAVFIRQTLAATRSFYVDNFSVTVSANLSYATDGGVDNAANFTTNWTAVSGSTVTRSTTVGNDTSDSAQVVTTGTGQGIRNKLSINPFTSTLYRITVYSASTTSGFNSFNITYSRDGGTNFVNCADYNTPTISSATTSFTEVTCYITTDGTVPTNPYVYFTQTDATGRTFYIDTFSMNISTNAVPNVQIGGGLYGGPVTLFTLDRGASAPIAANNDSLLGSMYYDTTLGKLQCYESSGWGACGSSPDNIITISPEYTNAVLHGTGVGTMNSDICSGTLHINDGTSSQPTICASNETYNFYKWTSPQASAQTYSIYVTYQLPNTFKSFTSSQTTLKGRTDSTNATVQYSVYRNNTGTGLTQCGTAVAVSTGSVASWQTGLATGAADPSTCSFSASDSIVFKIDVIASSNANAYVGNLGFTFSNK